MPSEILWGHRFESMLFYRKDHNKFQVNFSAFHSTYEVDTPSCSAKTLQKFHETNFRGNVVNFGENPELKYDSYLYRFQEDMAPDSVGLKA